MQDILKFVVDNQNKIDKDTIINIYLCKQNSNLSYDIKINEIQIKQILIKLKNNFDEIKKSINNYRLYKFEDMEYTIDLKNEKNIRKQILDKQIEFLDQRCIIATLDSKIDLPIDKFPCKNEYHDIININELKLYVNNLIEILILKEINSHSNFYKLKIRISKQNIYVDKVKRILNIIIGIILDSL
jgi:hypothetical protein